MDFRHYTDNAAALAAELANLFEQSDHRGADVPLADVAAVLSEHELRGDVAPDDVPRLRDLAYRLREIFEAADARAAGEAVNRLLAESRAAPRVSEHDGLDPHLHFSAPDADLVRRAAASTAMGLAVVLCDYGIERLGVCASHDCEDVFVDTSRNAQRRFCSTGCANRTNVAAHRARRRETAAG